MINLNMSMATRWGLNLLIILAMIGALYLGRTIFVPAVIALLFAALLWPGAVYLHQEGIPIPFFRFRNGFPWLWPHVYRARLTWHAACFILVIFLTSIALVITFGIGLAINKWIQELPTTDNKTQEVYDRFRDRVEATGIQLDPTYLPIKAKDSKLVQNIQIALDPERSSFIRDFLLTVGDYGLRWLFQWLIILFILLFLLLEGRLLSRRIVEIFGPSFEVQQKAGEALKDMATQIRVYLVWRTIINFAMALFLGMIYQIVGLSQPWTWALITAIFWYVPYLGTILAGVPPVLDAFLNCPSPLFAVGIIIFYILVVTLEGYVLVPVVMGRSMELNATTVMLACLFWELVWGTSGLFLAMPLMAAIKTICLHVPDWQPWANLMSTRDDVPIPPPDDEKKSRDNLEDTILMPLEDAKQLHPSRDDTRVRRMER